MMNQFATVLDDNPASLLQPDVIFPDQYLATLKTKSVMEPEKRLMLAVLEDAVYRFQKNVAAGSELGKEIFAEEKSWFFERGANWVFSFESICEAFDIDPDYVRRGLTRWQATHGRFSLVPLLLTEPTIAAEARAALAENRLQDAAGLLMDRYGLSCVEAGQLLDIAACQGSGVAAFAG
jgi:hypothetical protein